jgi:enoyl-CoA hydratase/carnithine racemase
MAATLQEEMNLLKKKLSAADEPTGQQCRVLVIKATLGGRNKNIWIAGGDLKELGKLTTPAEGKKYAQNLSHLCRCIEELPIPVIAQIDGAAIGGGAEFALAADLRLGCKATKFDFKQLGVGLSTGYASSHRLTQTIGLSSAKNLLFRQLSVDSEQAKNIGLLHEVYQNSLALEEETQKVCQHLCSINPKSLAVQKEMLRTATTSTYAESQALDHKLFESLWMDSPHKKFLADFANRS